MNKTAIKNYAIWARVQLIEAAKQRAYEYEIKESDNDPSLEIINGRILSSDEIDQRKELINLIKQKGFEQVMEEAAYTWFNRFIALRFMEVNGYLPSKVRVFTDENGEFKPQILKEAMSVDFDGIDKEYTLSLIDKQDNEELFKYLIITQCNALNSSLPGMFEMISNWTELLFPGNLLKTDSVIGKMISEIPEEDWTDQVQIIGWMYQYYNSELKDDTFAKLKKNIKISKERIPAATQLFTPDWIVRYMVENSLGRLWYEGHPDFDKSEWKYYLDEAEQEPEVEEELKKIRAEYAQIKPEDIKIIDPCMGSGHILVYAFDVLMQIYTSAGWSERDAAKSILENNLFGLDIDDRAGQLAYFAVMMKARKYNRRILNEYIRPRVMSIQESNGIVINMDRLGPETPIAKKLIDDLKDAKEYGSILNLKVTQNELNALKNRLEDIDEMADYGSLMVQYESMQIIDSLYPLIELAEIMIQKYDVVVTNPPYMGSQNMGDYLLEYIKNNYSDSKADIYAAFIERNFAFSRRFVSMITQSTWMFQSRFENIRYKLYQKLLVCMNHLGTRAFDEISGEVVQTTAFCYLNANCLNNYKTVFINLVGYLGERAKENAFSDSINKSYRQVGKFKAIPGAPFAHYISDNAIEDFEKSIALKNMLVPKQGTSTGDDETYIRYWPEVNYREIGFGFSSTQEAQETNFKFFPIDKGGEFRKWYGNNDRVIKFDSANYRILLNMGNHLPSRQYYFAEGLTWSKIASELSVRYSPQGFIFSSVGLKGFPSKDNVKYILAFMNSNVCRYFVKVISPGMSIVSGDIEKLPFIHVRNNNINNLCGENIEISKTDWDSFETSWDFKKHPLI